MECLSIFFYDKKDNFCGACGVRLLAFVASFRCCMQTTYFQGTELTHFHTTVLLTYLFTVLQTETHFEALIFQHEPVDLKSFFFYLCLGAEQHLVLAETSIPAIEWNSAEYRRRIQEV